MNSLDFLADKYGTDKGTTHHEKHNYTEAYDFYLNQYKSKVMNFLEIGINDPRFPGASMLMWREYFGELMYYRGFDINIDQHVKDIANAHPNTFLYNVDQTQPDQIVSVLMQMPALDVVVDDGIHTFEAQVNSFFTIFPYLKRGGLYFIEDCHAKDCHKTVDLLLNMKKYAADIASVQMFSGNKLILITKI
jgi:hypothetical protein